MRFHPYTPLEDPPPGVEPVCTYRDRPHNESTLHGPLCGRRQGDPIHTKDFKLPGVANQSKLVTIRELIEILRSHPDGVNRFWLTPLASEWWDVQMKAKWTDGERDWLILAGVTVSNQLIELYSGQFPEWTLRLQVWVNKTSHLVLMNNPKPSSYTVVNNDNTLREVKMDSEQSEDRSKLYRFEEVDLEGILNELMDQSDRDNPERQRWLLMSALEAVNECFEKQAQSQRNRIKELAAEASRLSREKSLDALSTRDLEDALERYFPEYYPSLELKVRVRQFIVDMGQAKPIVKSLLDQWMADIRTVTRLFPQLPE